MPATEFIAMISSPTVLGNPLLKTQHFIGGTRWEKVSDTEAIGYHQLRVPHQRYVAEDLKDVAVKGHAHSANQHWYKKVDGVWKFAGLRPDIRWSEYEFEKVFESGREELGEKVEMGKVEGDEKVPEVTRVEFVGADLGSEKERLAAETAMLHAVSV